MKGLEPDAMTAYPAFNSNRIVPSMAFLSGGRGGPGVRNPVFWLTLGWTVTHEPMLYGKPVILWHVVPLLLRGLGWKPKGSRKYQSHSVWWQTHPLGDPWRLAPRANGVE